MRTQRRKRLIFTLKTGSLHMKSCLFICQSRQQHFVEFQFVCFSAPGISKNTFYVQYYVIMEITVLYFKPCGCQSWFYSSNYPFTYLRCASLFKLKLRP